MPCWYALQVRSNAERQTQERLQLASIEDFSPLYKVKSRRFGPDRKPLWIERPLFTGYVFARVDRPQEALIQRIPSIIRVVGYGASPIVIPDSEIESIRIMADTKALIEPVAYAGNVGDWVMVTRGPLQGYEGQVMYVKNAARLVLSINQLHRSVSVEIDADCLEPVKQRRMAA